MFYKYIIDYYFTEDSVKKESVDSTKELVDILSRIPDKSPAVYRFKYERVSDELVKSIIKDAQ